MLAQEFLRRGHKVAVVTWNNKETDFYRLPMGATRFNVPLTENTLFVKWYDIMGNCRRLLAIRRAIRATEPEIVISFQDGTNELLMLSSFGQKFPKLLSCQIDIAQHAHFNARWERLRTILYRWADRVVFLDKDQAERASRCFPGWKCDGIPNPLPETDTIPDADAKKIIKELNRFPIRVAAMGRLAQQKGFDLLLEAFKKIIRDCPDVGLVILGEGPLRSQLENQRSQLGLQKQVLMPGRMKKPHAVIASCDIFIFCSRYEGQGLALLEAMACGVPAVSYDCPSGPSHIIRDNVDGILLPPEDIDALSDAVVTLLHDKEKRQALGAAARGVRNRYSAAEICSQWESLFQEVKS